jgi:outer membrane receptor protein involved in Fe transport
VAARLALPSSSNPFATASPVWMKKPGLRGSASGMLVWGQRAGGAALDPREAKQIEGGVKWQPLGTNALFTASYFDITHPRSAG